MQLPEGAPCPRNEDGESEDRDPGWHVLCGGPSSPRPEGTAITVDYRDPDDIEREREAAAWHEAHVATLKQLRARGRKWTPRNVYADRAPPTWSERAHLEHVERDATPCMQVLRGLAYDRSSPDADARAHDRASGVRARPWRAKPSPWLLFAHAPGRLPPLVKAALQQLHDRRRCDALRELAAATTPGARDVAFRRIASARSDAALALALAVRSWEPDEFSAGLPCAAIVPFKYEGTVRVANVPSRRSLEVAAADLAGHRV